MAKRKLYDYKYLLECKTDLKTGQVPFEMVGGNILMFPVDIKANDSANQWAVKCICGNTYASEYRAIKNSITKSCGCLLKRKNNYKNRLLSLKKAYEHDYTILKFNTEYRSRDLHIKCNVCGIETVKGSHSEHLVGNNKFCKCSRCYKATIEDVIEECEVYLQNQSKTSWSIDYYPEEYTNKKNYRLPLTCSKCGHKVSMLFGNFIRDKGCQKCSDLRLIGRIRKDLSYFIEKSVEKHGSRYDYSKVVYKKSREPVEIICREHGSFWQSPDNHYNKGKGCKKCNSNKHISYHRANIDFNKERYLTLPSGVYIAIVGKTIKLGLSSQPDRRISDIQHKSRLPCKILHYREINLYDAYQLENILHKTFSDYRSNFDNVFIGHTECFNLSQEQLDNAINILYDYKEEKNE